MPKPKLVNPTSIAAFTTVKFPTKKAAIASLEIFAARNKLKIKWNNDKSEAIVPIIKAKKVTRSKK